MSSQQLDFTHAAALLEAMCRDLEAGDAPDFEAFEFAEDALSEQVDRRIQYLQYAESQIERAKEMSAQWAKRRRHFETLVDVIKEETLAAIKTHPNLPYRGNFGAFKVMRNSVGRLEFSTEIDACNFPEYTKVRKELDTSSMKADLVTGKEIPGVSLVYGEHLRLVLE